MATVTDELRTAFNVVGIDGFFAAMNKAAAATEKLSNAEKERKKQHNEVTEALTEAIGAQALFAGRAGAFAFLIQEAVQAFQQNEDAAFRTTVLLRNLGNSYPIEQAQEFANAQQRVTGIAGQQILEVQALLKRFGAADKEVQGLTKTILDFSAATGITLEQAATSVGHALVGNTRQLKNMGIEFKATGDRAKDLATVQAKLNSLFGGAAEARLQTLSGAFDQFKSSLSDFFATVGDKISTVLIPVLHLISTILDQLAAHPVLATTIFGAISGGLLFGPKGAAIGGLVGLILGALPSRENPAAAIGTGKETLATEGTLKEVANNTKQISDSLVQRVLGGPGQVASRAFSIRDLSVAFGV